MVHFLSSTTYLLPVFRYDFFETMQTELIKQIAEALADTERRYFFNKTKKTVSSLPVFATQDNDFEVCVRVDLERQQSDYIRVLPLETEDLMDLYYDFALEMNAPNLVATLDEMQQDPAILVERFVAENQKQKDWDKFKTVFFEKSAQHWCANHC